MKTRKPCLLPRKDLIEETIGEMVRLVKRMWVDLIQIQIRIQVLFFESQTVLIRLVSPNCAYSASFAQICTTRHSFLKEKTVMLHLLEGPVKGRYSEDLR